MDKLKEEYGGLKMNEKIEKVLQTQIDDLRNKYEQLLHSFMSHRDNQGKHKREGGCLE